jgi:hypothetical protein
VSGFNPQYPPPLGYAIVKKRREIKLELAILFMDGDP